MKIYVISLKRAHERRKAIAKQLSLYNLDFAFIDAVDALAIGEDALRGMVDEAVSAKIMGRQLSSQEIACALSHRHVYELIVHSDEPGAIVLEDDAILTPLIVDALIFFEQISWHISGDWRMYHLELLSRGLGSYTVLKRRNPEEFNNKLLFAERVARVSLEAHGTCAYFITREAARSLAEERRILAAADIWSFHAKRGGGKIFVSVPAVVIHPPDQSNGYIEHSRRQLEEDVARRRGKVETFFNYLWGGLRARLLRLVIKPIAERFI